MAEFGEISTRFRFDADTRLGGFPCRSPKGYDAAPFRLSSQGRKHAAEQKGKPVIRCAPLRRVCRQSVLARRWTSSQPWRLKPEFPVSLCDERSCWIGYGGGRRHAPPLHGLTIPRAGRPCHVRRAAQKLKVSVTRLLRPGWVKRGRSARVLLSSRTSCQCQYWRSVRL